MKKFFRCCLVMTMMLATACVAFAQQKPNIRILATGGTIAGSGSSATKSNYSAGQVAIGALLDAVPVINEIANVQGEQQDEGPVENAGLVTQEHGDQLHDHTNQQREEERRTQSCEIFGM